MWRPSATKSSPRDQPSWMSRILASKQQGGGERFDRLLDDLERLAAESNGRRTDALWLDRHARLNRLASSIKHVQEPTTPTEVRRTRRAERLKRECVPS
jgi:hypothetical protein